MISVVDDSKRLSIARKLADMKTLQNLLIQHLVCFYTPMVEINRLWSDF
jgi:hypothetical protein